MTGAGRRDAAPRRAWWVGVAALVLACALGGCGAEAPGAAPPPDRDEPTTARALAAVAAEHAGTPDSATRERDAAEEFAPGAVGAELRYGSDGEYDGDVLVVATGTGLDPAVGDCAAAAGELDGCVVTDEGVLMWEGEAPEEDPGVVYVRVDKGEASVLLFYAGPAITGDPRGLDLPIPTDLLLAIANDPRVDVTTSAEALEAGAELSFWRSHAP